MTCCEMSGHLDQIRDYPVGTIVENTVALAAASGAVPIGSKGRVTLHCADGRAWIVFDGYPVGHTFHDPAKYVRIVSAPIERKAAEINLDETISFARAWAEAPARCKRVTEMDAAEFFYWLGVRDGKTEGVKATNEDLKEMIRIVRARIT